MGCAAFFATQVVVSNGATAVAGQKDSFASLAGLSLSYAITATGMMQFVVRSFATVEASMNSTERVVYYSEEIPQEAAMTSNEFEREAVSATTTTTTRQQQQRMSTAQRAVAASGGEVLRPTESWPTKGAISLTNMRMPPCREMELPST